MKTLTFPFAFLVLVLISTAQSPKDGAVISLNKYDYELKVGETLEIPALLVRASRFSKGKIDGLIVQEKEGITSSVLAEEDQPDLYIIKLKASNGMKKSAFPLIIKAEGKSAYKVKQTMIMVTVSDGEQVVSNNR